MVKRRIARLLVNHPKVLKLMLLGLFLVFVAAVGVLPNGPNEEDPEDDLIL